jgi:hypothetical protein
MSPKNLAMMQELLRSIGGVLDGFWDDPKNAEEESVKKSVVMTTLTNALVASAVAYEVPIELLLYHIASTMSTHGMLDDDDHPVH